METSKKSLAHWQANLSCIFILKGSWELCKWKNLQSSGSLQPVPSDRPALSPHSASCLLCNWSLLLRGLVSSAENQDTTFHFKGFWGTKEIHRCKGRVRCPGGGLQPLSSPHSFAFAWKMQTRHWQCSAQNRHWRIRMGLLPAWTLDCAAPAPCSLCLSAIGASSGSWECRHASLASPGMKHWLICHLPVADKAPSVLLLPIYLPAFSSFCHHSFSNSTLFWHPLCSEHCQWHFCIFLFWNIPWNSSYHLWSHTVTSRGRPFIAAKILRFSCLRNGFLFALTLALFHSNLATSWIPRLFCLSLTVLFCFSYAALAFKTDKFILFQSF